jgi:dolichol-phosphate mannosyltransferase
MLSILLPAYNEALGLPDLLDRVGRTMAAYGRRYQIIVVDDGSTDGTAAVAEAAREFLPVKLVRHPVNQGLGRALRTGLFSALEDSDVVVTMDADNSHDPELIPLMAERLDQGYDVVVASRFQEGGAEVGVALHRRLLSHTASMLLRSAFPLEGVRDYSSGFRAYSGEILRRLVEQHGAEGLVEEQGFACMLEVLLKAGALGARMSEVPLVLRYDRKRGASKMRILRTVRRYGALMRHPKVRYRHAARAAANGGWAASEQARRALNVTLATAGLVLAAPVMLAIAVLIKLTSPGPVFYTQTRVGLDRRHPLRNGGNQRRIWDYGGKPFTLYKFRTMHVNAERGRGPVWATPDDPRVTPIGRVLRKYRVDELPQLFNVLWGHMNLVGPRPERPQIVEHLARRITGYRERLRVLPGITGWAQVNHHYDRSFDDVRRKVALDLEYVARQSVLEDLRIVFQTVPVVLLKRGAW